MINFIKQFILRLKEYLCYPRFFYISYEIIDGEYNESGEDIIQAKNKKHAIKQLKEEKKQEGEIKIDIIYETTEDAML